MYVVLFLKERDTSAGRQLTAEIWEPSAVFHLNNTMKQVFGFDLSGHHYLQWLKKKSAYTIALSSG